MSAFEYAKRRLFEPLGINQVSWPMLADGRTQGGWGMYLSPMDMLKIGQMLSDGGTHQGRRIVSKSYVDEMFTRRVETHLNSGYGYQLWLPDDHGHKNFGAARGYGGLASAGFPEDMHPVICGNYGDFWTTFKCMLLISCFAW